MSTLKSYLIIYMPTYCLRVIFIDEDSVIDAYLNSTYRKKYIPGFDDFLVWHDGLLYYEYSKVRVTESGYPVLFYNNRTWIMVEAFDVYDAVKKAETILHEKIKR